MTLSKWQMWRCPSWGNSQRSRFFFSVKMSKEDVKVKMSRGERNPLTVKISQGHIEEGDAKAELQETHFKSKKVPPSVNTTEKSSNKGPQCFSLGLSAGGVYKLGEIFRR